MRSSFPLVVLSVCLYAFCCNALVARSAFQVRSHGLTDFEQFGFAAHGSISLSATTFPVQQNMSLYICTDQEYDVLTSYYETDTRQICNDPSVCEKTVDYSTKVNYHVDKKSIYRIFPLFEKLLRYVSFIIPTLINFTIITFIFD